MYFKLNIQGNMGVIDVWSINPVFHLLGAVGPVWNQEAGDAIVAALIAQGSALYGTTMRSLMTPSESITRLRLEARDEDESLLGASEGIYTSPITGVGSGGINPPQTACVLSLRTSLPGARGRGRLYWPATGALLHVATKSITTPEPEEIATEAAAFLTRIQESIEDNAGIFPFTSVELGVRSVTDHATRSVVRIEVGSIPDVQRRRRDATREAYKSSDYPNP